MPSTSRVRPDAKCRLPESAKFDTTNERRPEKGDPMKNIITFSAVCALLALAMTSCTSTTSTTTTTHTAATKTRSPNDGTLGGSSGGGDGYASGLGPR